MRASVISSDPGYCPEDALFLEVLLDGVKLNLCHTADEETGEAWVYLTEKEAAELGICGIEPTTKLTGKVVIRDVRKA